MIDEAKKREIEKGFLSLDAREHATAGEELFKILLQSQAETRWVNYLAWQFMAQTEEKYKAERKIIEDAMNKIELLWTDAKRLN